MTDLTFDKSYPDLTRFLGSYPKDIKLPRTVSDVLQPIISVEGTSAFAEMKYATGTMEPGSGTLSPTVEIGNTGSAGVGTQVPAGKLWVPIAINLLHNSTVSKTCYLGFSMVPQTGGRAYIGITDMVSVAANQVVGRFDRPRLYLPPGCTVFGFNAGGTWAALEDFIIVMAYLEIALGETIPP